MNSGRPTYETEKDLVKERAVVQALCSSLGCTFCKLPVSYGLDYALHREGTIFSMIEIKCRDSTSSRYETIMVSVLKRMKALELRRAAGVTTNFVVAYTDGIYLIDFAEKPDYVAVGGRKDRGDSADIEPCVHYSVGRLARVAGPLELVA